VAREAYGLCVGERGEQRAGAFGFVGSTPQEELVQHHAHRPHVDAGVEVARAAGLLGRHVRGRADRAVTGHRGLVAGGEEGHAEIDHARREPTLRVWREEHVLWLHVAVDDARRVRRGEAFHDGAEELHRLVRRSDEPLLHPIAEGPAAHQLLREVEAPFGLVATEVEDAHHVGMLDARDGAGLAEEAGLGGGARVVHVNHLDGHRLLQQHVPRFKHGAMAADAQHAREGVAPAQGAPDPARRSAPRLHGARPRGAHRAHRNPWALSWRSGVWRARAAVRRRAGVAAGVGADPPRSARSGASP
jgi:hypothetical protein